METGARLGIRRWTALVYTQAVDLVRHLAFEPGLPVREIRYGVYTYAAI